ncbi:hypothetical protein C2845_PM09G12480 [Panicum miliaceum]|uniref:Uncharacterized protein n=1 Tax=Panicum miliaceum TaxID=4540 RepID=A0A3L6S0B9_PANMI|nr:hypothetical protein C2845_PM09G12480 [Panicum miliaceum]
MGCRCPSCQWASEEERRRRGGGADRGFPSSTIPEILTGGRQTHKEHKAKRITQKAFQVVQLPRGHPFRPVGRVRLGRRRSGPPVGSDPSARSPGGSLPPGFGTVGYCQKAVVAAGGDGCNVFVSLGALLCPPTLWRLDGDGEEWSQCTVSATAEQTGDILLAVNCKSCFYLLHEDGCVSKVDAGEPPPLRMERLPVASLAGHLSPPCKTLAGEGHLLESGVFVSPESAFAVRASEAAAGCMGNCVYFVGEGRCCYACHAYGTTFRYGDVVMVERYHSDGVGQAVVLAGEIGARTTETICATVEVDTGRVAATPYFVPEAVLGVLPFETTRWPARP